MPRTTPASVIMCLAKMWVSLAISEEPAALGWMALTSLETADQEDVRDTSN